MSAHSVIVDAVTRPATRARPLAPEERRASIIAATIPLLLEHGTSVTSRQIADAAGIAEGTIFRVFTDKDSLIDAAVEAFMTRSHESDDPLPDSSLSLEEKVSVVLTTMRHRVRDVMRMAAVTGRRPGPLPEKGKMLMRWRVREIFGPHVDELALNLDELADYLRAIAVGTSIPAIDDRPPLPDDRLAVVVVGGLRRATPAPVSPSLHHHLT